LARCAEESMQRSRCLGVVRPRAFTLIELLVVVAIIALLISILIPSLKAARAQARTVVCQNNVRQLAMAWRYYSHDHRDRLPGSTWDYFPASNGKPEATLCWLGSRNGGGADDENWAPVRGTVFKYTGRAV